MNYDGRDGYLDFSEGNNSEADFDDWGYLYWRTEALIDVRRNMAAANSINRSVRQYRGKPVRSRDRCSGDY